MYYDYQYYRIKNKSQFQEFDTLRSKVIITAYWNSKGNPVVAAGSTTASTGAEGFCNQEYYTWLRVRMAQYEPSVLFYTEFPV